MRPLITQTLSIATNGIRLHAEAMGPESGPLVILLHGFPEFWYGWRNQMGSLARSGFRVIVPDQRGYNLSDKPRGVNAYRMDELVKDVVGIIDHFGREKAVVIGHDWGASVAWNLALQHPERVERLGILNVPHPAAMARALTGPFSQQVLRSWYIYFFQIPRLPEFLLGFRRGAGIRRMLVSSSKPTTFSQDDLQRYRQACTTRRLPKQETTLTAMINWYRAAFFTAVEQGREGYLKGTQARVTVPTLILWGERDVAVASKLAQWSLEYCDQGELVRFPEATHWVQHDEAERVTNRLLDFLKEMRLEGTRIEGRSEG